MTTQSGNDPLRRRTPPHERGDSLSKPPNSPTSSSRRDRIARERKVLEDKRRDYEKRYGSITSQKLPNSKTSGENPPPKGLEERSNYGWGEIKDYPADSPEGEESVHWLDALLAENLSPAEFRDRLKKINAQPDPYIEDLRRSNAELDATMQRHKEKKAELLKQKEELAAWRSTGKPPRRAGRLGDRNSSEDEYQRKERERSRIQREYGEPSQLLDWIVQDVRNVDGRKSWGYEDTGEGWEPTHKESQDPVIKAEAEAESTKPSDSGKSKGHENAEDWWKPFERAPRKPVTTTLKDPLRIKPSTKSAKWEEGLGSGEKDIQPFAGGRLPFHNEPESPLDAAERLENQLNANEESKHKSKYKRPSAVDFQEPLDANKEYIHKHKIKSNYKSPSVMVVQGPLDSDKQEKVKKSSPMTEKIVQNAPLPVSSAARNDRNRYTLTWMEMLIVSVIGIAVGKIALRLSNIPADAEDISGSLKWGLGKTCE
ncbi:uncharacterized protein EAE97_006837 [Botrytis byssoidea]|uniref:Uncharacterized protein n=1 Tax=Botrytis byssoidea TaxID=139641 RepID=A0A9P5IQ57_9HELO|nr:uncharacterized protein EAE97_006837 [Botrytis byssoidea]KAF7940651.1 hypothetical protein EAE97_006837 [Botrytis byssoidea]